jgi:hypothetical protein
MQRAAEGQTSPVGFTLKEVVIETHVVSELSGEVGLKLWVVTAEGAAAERAGQKLTIRLEPDKPPPLLGKEQDDDDYLKG